jgi:Ser-tRNA(Ala) deacylase AlaX
MSKNYYEPMHTAEHILNQVMLRSYTGERSFTTHIERKKSKVDYNFHRNLSTDEIKSIEDQVNNVIMQKLEVSEKILNLEEASEKFDLSRLPENSGNKIRIIEIANFDACPCIGQHVSNTSEIGEFKIISTDYDDNKLRIRFKLLDKSE